MYACQCYYLHIVFCLRAIEEDIYNIYLSSISWTGLPFKVPLKRSVAFNAGISAVL